MQSFTDIFIRRPVLATVISLLILLVGLRSYLDLTVRQYPESNKAVVTIQTVYTGASAELVKGFVTTPLEKEIASADGIDYIESTSVQGMSIINANLDLNYDPYQALTQISSKVDRVRSELPQEAETPTLDVQVGSTTASMYISFTSESMTPSEITDYLNRVVVPELSTIAGVQQAQILGGSPFGMRVWLQPDKLAAYGLTPADVRAKLAANNFLATVGQTKGDLIVTTLDADTDLTDVEEFRQLAVKEAGATVVRLEDVAEVELGAESYATSTVYDGREGPFIGVNVLPTANELTVIADVSERFAELQEAFPTALDGQIVYDATRYIEDAIDEVAFTLILALGIVTVVIYLFLGSLRTVAIPIIAMPLSLIGTGIIMLLLGFSVNLLTLLALVLAIGLVVDDAIIVVENIHRHIEEEEITPFQAALQGARELALPIVAMSITLIAVYLPIGFIGGLTGNLFTEFAFTLAGAVFISGVVAITLSPMLCSKILKKGTAERGFAHWLDQRFEALRARYDRRLHNSLDYRPVTYVFAAAVLVSCYFLFVNAQSELAPTEDQGILFVQATAQPNASLRHLEFYTREMGQIFKSFPETDDYFLVNGIGGGGAVQSSNNAISGMKLVPWSERERTPADLQPLLSEKLRNISGLDAVAFELPPLPGAGGGLPVQFVIGTTAEPEELLPVSQELLQRARESGMFIYADTDLKYDRPQVQVHIDREQAAALGLSMQDIGANLATMLSGGYVNRFSIQGRSYKVIPQVVRGERLNAEQLEQYYVRAESGQLVPLSSVVSLETEVRPRDLKRFQQLNATMLSAVPMPGVSTGDALAFLQAQAAEILPADYKVDYAGQSRQFVQESGALVVTFFFAVIVIFLVLAAQFESFRDPAIILVSVPLSVSGALVFLTLGFTTINIYTQVGLITLIGLISKHGILIVEFANQLQRQGLPKREAIERAAGLRLRPILMTTAATVAGVVPLVVATGAGAASRYSMGLVIATGMSIGTLFTLFVVPAIYMLLAQEHEKGELEGPPGTGSDGSPAYV